MRSTRSFPPIRLAFHYGKHHKTYVDTLNKLIAGTEFADMPLEQIVKAASGKSDHAAIFNNAAQAWNHTFYWRSLKPKGGGEPPAAVKRLLESSFGSVEACKKELATAAVGQFGSGWAWLVQDGGKLKVVKTGECRNAADRKLEAAADHRRMGARLLSRLPESAGRLCERLAGKAAQLGFAAENLGGK
jgi:superoxide dismutase